LEQKHDIVRLFLISLALKLIDFYIENKNRITLHFEDGSSKTVPAGRLRAHIGGEDLARVLKALELKRSYLRRFPDWLKVWAVAAGVLAVVAASGKAATPLWRPSEAKPNPVLAVTQTPVEAVAGAGIAPSVTPEKNLDPFEPERLTSGKDESAERPVGPKRGQKKKAGAYKKAIPVLELKDRPSNNLF
jgi:hypothetical protein